MVLLFQLNHCDRIVFVKVPSRFLQSFFWLTKTVLFLTNAWNIDIRIIFQCLTNAWNIDIHLINNLKGASLVDLISKQIDITYTADQRSFMKMLTLKKEYIKKLLKTAKKHFQLIFLFFKLIFNTDLLYYQ